MPYHGLAEKIYDYIQGRLADKLEIFDKNSEKTLKAELDPDKRQVLESEQLSERLAIESKYKPNIWLEDASERARQIMFATHAAKFTHPNSKGSNIFAIQTDPDHEFDDCFYLATDDLANKSLDVMGNAAALDVGKLLNLEHEGQTLLEQLQGEDFSSLEPFSNSKDQLSTWVKGLLKVLENTQPSSHTLMKQLYFPVGNSESQQYHLLSPLFSSSFTQVICDRITESRFSESKKAARKAKRENKFSEIGTVDYLNIAVQSFGGSKPQNISQLNSQRGGKVFLLNNAPPTWQAYAKPPKKNVITSIFSHQVRRDIKEYRNFLVKHADKTSNGEVAQTKALMSWVMQQRWMSVSY